MYGIGRKSKSWKQGVLEETATVPEGELDINLCVHES